MIQFEDRLMLGASGRAMGEVLCYQMEVYSDGRAAPTWKPSGFHAHLEARGENGLQSLRTGHGRWPRVLRRCMHGKIARLLY